MRKAGFSLADLPLEVSISGDAATGGAIFFGTPVDIADNPVITEVSLPSSSWKLAAVPKGGWSETPEQMSGESG